MARESADEKIARVVQERVEAALAGQRDRDEESKDPNWARMRKVIREEVSSILGPMLKEREGKGRTSRGDNTDDGEEEKSSPFSLFG